MEHDKKNRVLLCTMRDDGKVTFCIAGPYTVVEMVQEFERIASSLPMPVHEAKAAGLKITKNRHGIFVRKLSDRKGANFKRDVQAFVLSTTDQLIEDIKWKP